jgi:hypothetical protein
VTGNNLHQVTGNNLHRQVCLKSKD